MISAYTALTGRTPLPPRWALGYHQSRYSYQSEKEGRKLAARFREERFPVDAIWLDIDFQQDGNVGAVHADAEHVAFGAYLAAAGGLGFGNDGPHR